MLTITNPTFGVTFIRGRDGTSDNRHWRFTVEDAALVDTLLPVVGKALRLLVKIGSLAPFEITGLLEDLILDDTGGVRFFVSEEITVTR